VTLGLLSFVSFFALTLSVDPLSPIHTGLVGDPHFYDEFGRVRIFHGCNRVKKGFPWYFTDMLDSGEMQLMQDIGFNVIRLGYMWTGYNPQPDTWNETYVDQTKIVVKNLADHGIYTLLDMHQDILSSKFCLYDGVPRWVIDKSVPKHAFPWPLTGNCSSRTWGMNGASQAAATAYQDIYDNNHGMFDDLKAFWSKSAQHFVNDPAIIGYETMNEPFAGNFFQDPTLLLPGEAGKKNLQRLHDGVAEAIRTVDDHHIIFYEPVTWGMVFDGSGIAGSGLTHVPGGPAYQNRSAYSFHYYCMTFVKDYENKPLRQKFICDKAVGPSVMKAVNGDLAVLGGAAMMTEGMACDYDTPAHESECEIVRNLLDDNLFSWTDYGESQGDTWDISLAEQKSWARSYARAIAGRPLNQTYDVETGDFKFCFSIDASITQPTEIFGSTKYVYTSGIKVVTSPNLKWELSPSSKDVVLVTPIDASQKGEGCVQFSK